jgi:hypothetical protein
MSRPISRGGHPSKSSGGKAPIEWGSVHITSNSNASANPAAIQQHVVQALTRSSNDPSPIHTIYADSPPPVKYAALGGRNTVSDVRGSQFRMPNLQQAACSSCEEMAKQLKGLKAKMDQMRQGRQDIERLAHVRVRESESALADLLQENNMLREALEKLQSGSAGPADTDKDRLEREELERLKKQLHAAEQESQYYKEEFERWRRQAASVEDRLVATSGALQERTIAAQKLQERVVELETELARVLAAPAAVVEPALPPCKDLSDELGAAIAERDAAVQRASSLQSEVDELRRALALQKQESEAAISAVKLQAEQTESARAQLESELEASRRECSDVKAAADAAVAAAEVGLKIAKGQRDELENDLKDAKRVAQVGRSADGIMWRVLQSIVVARLTLFTGYSRAPNRHHHPSRARARRIEAKTR